MDIETKNINKEEQLDFVLKELAEIKSYLKKLLFFIPEENLDEYQNEIEIKESYQEAIKEFPPTI